MDSGLWALQGTHGTERNQDTYPGPDLGKQLLDGGSVFDLRLPAASPPTPTRCCFHPLFILLP